LSHLQESMKRIHYTNKKILRQQKGEN